MYPPWFPQNTSSQFPCALHTFNLVPLETEPIIELLVPGPLLTLSTSAVTLTISFLLNFPDWVDLLFLRELELLDWVFKVSILISLSVLKDIEIYLSPTSPPLSSTTNFDILTNSLNSKSVMISLTWDSSSFHLVNNSIASLGLGISIYLQ